MTDVRGRVAVVTGAAKGIGASMATALAEHDAHVVLADVDERALEALSASLQTRGLRVTTMIVDVSDADAVDALASHSFGIAGDVAVLVNNAGVLGEQGVAWERSLDSWRRVLAINLDGVINGIRAFVPRMITQATPAHVVNTGSAASLGGVPFNAAYSASKHAVLAISDCLRDELRSRNAQIAVTVMCPGVVRTGIAGTGRPLDLAVLSDEERQLAEISRRAFERGIPPEAVAQALIRAIREEHYLCFTDDVPVALAERRHLAVLKGAGHATVNATTHGEAG